MKNVKRFVVVVGLVSVLAPAVRAAESDGWVALFDGKSLDGWTVSENPSTFKVVDGAICVDGPRAHAFYTGPVRGGKFKNFEFRCEVRTEPGANSGVFFHTRAQTGAGWPARGYEVQINNTQPPHNGYYECKKTGSLYGIRNVYKSPVCDREWFALHITVRGKHIQVRVNDTLTVDYVEPARPARGAQRDGRTLSSGTFALQGHDPSSRVAFRNIQVKPLADDLADDVDGPVSAQEESADVLALGMSNFPVLDLHAHLKGGLKVEEVEALSRRTGIGYGVAPNCGVGFPITDDKGIEAFVASMKGRCVFLGMQAEGREWVKTFSPKAVALFDYVFTDSMTFTDDRTGKRTRLWVQDEFEVGDKQQFMDMLVGKIESICDREPIDIYVNPTFLPKPIAGEYDALWTPERMKKVVAALARNGVAMEINARYKLPSTAFIKLAKQAGVKFTFGTNNGGKDDLVVPAYCLEMIRQCNLTPKDLFVPGSGGKKAIERKAMPK
ncbi:MAG: hypothetical protein BWX88_04778 [Planctomycetes bacterium ADurb.Bin126]|nr:MAG: hypothetical protein BWX88_04778 [Planctomycetes bacterium ADurb.Bin126]HOD84459.1 DUF1080 domain-containing protein [Phycisphaerae bacterium]HQL75343.1 DUF1080 domain-containing protein [Phycisphaerae bacterium]